MSKYFRNIVLVALCLNVAASTYYLLFNVVGISVYWQSCIAGLKAGWPYLPLLVAGGASCLIRNKFAMIASMTTCYGAALYFMGLSSIALFKVLLQHTTATHLALGTVWMAASCGLVIGFTAVRGFSNTVDITNEKVDKAVKRILAEANHFSRIKRKYT